MREGCQNAGNEEACGVVKLCLDHRVAIMPNQNNSDNGPLLAVCANCAEDIKRMDPPANYQQQQSDGNDPPVEPLIDLLLPMQQVSATCDNTVIFCVNNNSTHSFIHKGLFQ